MSAPIAWSSKKQSIVALSTTEAELIALAEGLKIALWFKQALEGLEIKHKPIMVHQDNQSCIALVNKEALASMRTKHIDLRYMVVRDYVSKKKIVIVYCSTDNMLADIMTKALGKVLFTSFASRLGLVLLGD